MVNVKQQKVIRTGVICFIIAILTLACMVGTMAKYVTQGSFNDDARVAKWGLNIPGSEDINLFSPHYYGKSPYDQSYTVQSANDDNVVAPGTDQSAVISLAEVTGHAPEVAYDFKTKIEASDYDASGLIAELDKINTFHWFLIDPLGKRTNCNTFDELEDAVYGMSRTNVPPNTLPDSISRNGERAQEDFKVYNATIGWWWDFEDEGKTSAQDKADTRLGDLSAFDKLKDMKLTLTAEAVQTLGSQAPTTSVTGTVMYAGNTVSDAEVAFRTSSNTLYGWVKSDANGYFEIPDVPERVTGTLLYVYPGGDKDIPFEVSGVKANGRSVPTDKTTIVEKEISAVADTGGSIEGDANFKVPYGWKYSVNYLNQEVDFGKFGKFKAIEDDNHIFDKWNYDESGTVVQDIPFKAFFTPLKFGVHVDASQGTFDVNAINSGEMNPPEDQKDVKSWDDPQIDALLEYSMEQTGKKVYVNFENEDTYFKQDGTKLIYNWVDQWDGYYSDIQYTINPKGDFADTIWSYKVDDGNWVTMTKGTAYKFTNAAYTFKVEHKPHNPFQINVVCPGGGRDDDFKLESYTVNIPETTAPGKGVGKFHTSLQETNIDKVGTISSVDSNYKLDGNKLVYSIYDTSSKKQNVATLAPDPDNTKKPVWYLDGEKITSTTPVTFTDKNYNFELKYEVPFSIDVIVDDTEGAKFDVAYDAMFYDVEGNEDLSATGVTSLEDTNIPVIYDNEYYNIVFDGESYFEVGNDGALNYTYYCDDYSQYNSAKIKPATISSKVPVWYVNGQKITGKTNFDEAIYSFQVKYEVPATFTITLTDDDDGAFYYDEDGRVPAVSPFTVDNDASIEVKDTKYYDVKKVVLTNKNGSQIPVCCVPKNFEYKECDSIDGVPDSGSVKSDLTLTGKIIDKTDWSVEFKDCDGSSKYDEDASNTLMFNAATTTPTDSSISYSLDDDLPDVLKGKIVIPDSDVNKLEIGPGIEVGTYEFGIWATVEATHRYAKTKEKATFTLEITKGKEPVPEGWNEMKEKAGDGTEYNFFPAFNSSDQVQGYEFSVDGGHSTFEVNSMSDIADALMNAGTKTLYYKKTDEEAQKLMCYTITDMTWDSVFNAISGEAKAYNNTFKTNFVDKGIYTAEIGNLDDKSIVFGEYWNWNSESEQIVPTVNGVPYATESAGVGFYNNYKNILTGKSNHVWGSYADSIEEANCFKKAIYTDKWSWDTTTRIDDPPSEGIVLAKVFD